MRQLVLSLPSLINLNSTVPLLLGIADKWEWGYEDISGFLTPSSKINY